MDFFTRCSRNNRFKLALCLTCLLVLAGIPRSARPQSGPALQIVQIQAEREDDGVFLTAHLRLVLPSIVEDALHRGIAMFFVAEAEILRDRWYWYDRKVAVAAKHMRLAYQPLTRRWRLNMSPEPIGNVGLGVSFAQNFDSLNDALQAIQRISHWKIAGPGLLETDARHNIAFRFWLDMSQLPRPFQIGVVGQSEWSIAASGAVRLSPEAAK